MHATQICTVCGFPLRASIHRAMAPITRAHTACGDADGSKLVYYRIRSMS